MSGDFESVSLHFLHLSRSPGRWNFEICFLLSWPLDFEETFPVPVLSSWWDTTEAKLKSPPLGGNPGAIKGSLFQAWRMFQFPCCPHGGIPRKQK